MTTARLDAKTGFSAVSYAWGNSPFISSALLDALLQLQQDDDSGEKLYWIDANCISQHDLMEKSEQVQIMGDIYRQASEVIIWLDKDDPVFTKNGIREAIAAADVSKEQNNEHEKSFMSVKSNLDIFTHQFDFDSVVQAVGTLISRSWWRRLWVLQELVLSQQAHIRCGPLSITWESFEYFLDICELFMLCNPTHPTLSPAYLISYKAFILSKCWRTVRSGRELTMFQLFEMMITMAVRETSNPRDRVYALLGLAEDREQLGIRPDYSLSCAHMYMRTAEALISEHGLVMLSYCDSRRSGKPHTAGFPSWAPDLTGTVRDALRGNETAHIYNTSRSTKEVTRFLSRVSIRLLSVHSLVIGKVAWNSEERPFPNAPFDTSKAKVLRKWLRKIPFCWGDEKARSATARALIADRISKRGQETSREASPPALRP
ncbi:hypothetical protein N0V83_006127 [Neocucurbitaria cava]|uniref:Heterokaryon incompatibility domain-containing protein n=1 Tax=Neocucurbitaria cava TaxID=798079 RepID=A0A9W9CLP0_9PLEO|nr:hypothetical protein N0V83_006127 [Neocucurbitaria cava]